MQNRIPTTLIAVAVIFVLAFELALVFWSTAPHSGYVGLVLAAALLGLWIHVLRRNKPWRVVLLYLGSLAAIAFCLQLMSVVIVAVMAGWLGDPFSALLGEGWVGFVFVRFLILLLVAVAIRSLWRSFPRVTALVTALAILSLAAFAIVESNSPDGTYGCVGELEPMNDAPDIAPELYHKDHFWRFSHGKVEDCFGNECSHYGRYEKTADGWVVVHEIEEPFTWRLQFSVFGFRLIRIEDQGATAFCPRRIIPFPRPYWMPDWLQ
jgi:hypothetical protein